MTRAVEELKQIPFAHLIGAPLKAAIESQALAAKTTVDFIKEVGFKAPSTGDPIDIALGATDDADMGEVRNVTFEYHKKDGEDDETKFELTVPILTITPIPYIRIDEMTIDFHAKLTDSVVDTRTSNTAVAATISGSYGSFWTPVKVNFRVSASHKTSTSQTAAQKREYSMDIHVRAVQDEMPAGLSKILDILEDAIKNQPATTS
ncbi:MAG: DUF2589 domain-containing protein [Desulfobacteraceae bacterium]|nr:DUF2589 domain-containing protein [Desulfobacteraceae bacterium]